MNISSSGQVRRMWALVTLVLVGCVLFGLTAGQAAAAPDENPAGRSAVPGVSLSAPVSGREAVESLGAALPGVAAAYGLSVSELSDRLLGDRTLTVDRDGRLFFLDVAPPAGDLAVAEAATPAVALGKTPAPLADTFLLHSLPGADRVIYLDFDGHVLSNCAWNAYTGVANISCPPYDIDGVPGSFNDEERTRIQEIWQRVAEDYAPFAVDVTTEFPGEDRITRSSSLDRVYGMRVLISPISKYVGSYGGIAYINVFDSVGDYYKPALVFPENLGPNVAKYVAEAASHENGHTLALYHDGTTAGVEYYSGHGSGDTGWAPIMGSGYYKNLTQWSKGEYSLANNKEDDLAILSTSARIPYRTDDHGGSIPGATKLTGTGQLSASGVVGKTGDVDVFSVAGGAGTLAVSASPVTLGSNLDIQLELWGSNGAVLASSNPSDLLTASISRAVTAGTYYVAVRGTGRGDPLTGYSNYATLGGFSLSLTVPATSGNQAPNAVIAANPTSGTAPLSVSFNGGGSSDPDGSIASYTWAFGDGGSASGATASHTYTAAGTYTATLTVTDNAGATGTAQTTITVTASTAKIMYLASKTVSVVKVFGGYQARAVVKIVDGNGLPVSRATVKGVFSGAVKSTATGTTGLTGLATLSSIRFTVNGAVAFDVTSVTKTGWVYGGVVPSASTAGLHPAGSNLSLLR